MPRGVKGSGEPKTTVKAKKTVKAAKNIIVKPVVKAKRGYPSRDERVIIADNQIERLTKLNASRTELIAKTEKVLNERKEALAKSTIALENALAKKERLLMIKSKPQKAACTLLTPEERKARIAAGRAAKKAERERLAELAALLKANGKSVDDLLAQIKPIEQ